MGNRYTQTGDSFFQRACALVNGFYTVMQVVNLAAALHFSADGIVDNGIGMLHHEGLHGITVGRGLLQGGHIPDAGQGHIQRSGDRGCGQGQHIHTFGHLLETLLVADAEALLLVDDQKTQILELDTLLQQFVCADNQIHLAGSQILQSAVLLGRGAETAEHINGHRKTPETADSGLIMLLGKYGGRHQNCCLLAVHNTLHNGPQSHLGFAEAYIAAQQPVHWCGRFHIGFDVCNAPKLVIGFGVGEIVLKFQLPGRVSSECKSNLPFSGGIELYQFAGHILGGFSGFGFGLLPGIGANFVQLYIGIFATAADILAYQIQLSSRYKQRIAALVSNLHIVFDSAIHTDLFHSHETADAVVFVDNQITGGEVSEGIQLLAVGCAFLYFAFDLPMGQKLTFCQHRQFCCGIFHTVGERTLCQ